MKLLIFLSFLVVVSACSDLKKGKQLEQLEEIIASYDSIVHDYKMIDSIDFSTFFNEKYKLLDTIVYYYDDRLIKLASAKKIDLLNYSKKDAIQLMELQSYFISSVEEQKKSVNLLKLDITNGSGNKMKYDEYVQFEQLKYQQLKNQLEDFKIRKQRCLENYNASHKFVDDLINHLKNN